MPTYPCPRCSRPVDDEFRICPYCGARLTGGPTAIPTVLPAPAEREARRDLTATGIGLIVLGVLAFAGVALALSAGLDNPDHRWSVEAIAIVGGGAVLTVIA